MVLENKAIRSKCDLLGKDTSSQDFKRSDIVYVVAHASADYIDPVTKKCYYQDNLTTEKKNLLPLPDVNELVLLKKYIEERMSWDRKKQRKMLREIQEVISSAEGKCCVHRNGCYDSYSKCETKCIHELFTFLEVNMLLDDWETFREKEMFVIAKAWYAKYTGDEKTD